MSEGYIKFNCDWTNNDFSFTDEEFSYIDSWRNRLFGLNLIGSYSNGVGFGNISTRYRETDNFLISGSATGHLSNLSKQHYSLVKDYKIVDNHLSCIGRVKASSESLSHASIYESSTKIKAVIHIHNQKLYKKLKNKEITTSENVEYGTPFMAFEIKNILTSRNLNSQGIIVMGGHEDGLISFGTNLDIAGQLILEKFEEL